jgi:hypothetical protein
MYACMLVTEQRDPKGKGAIDDATSYPSRRVQQRPGHPLILGLKSEPTKPFLPNAIPGHSFLFMEETSPLKQ